MGDLLGRGLAAGIVGLHSNEAQWRKRDEGRFLSGLGARQETFNPGGQFRSADRGDSCSLLRGLWDDTGRKGRFGGGCDRPGIRAVPVHPEDSRRITLAIFTGGLWFSENGGERWTPTPARLPPVYAFRFG
jgi:hypothetical protein